MAEVLRELVVQLSLDADNYTRNMRSIAAQVKQVEATFKNSGAGIKDFEKSLEGMRAKQSSLTQTTQLQSMAVDQASRRLAVANQNVARARQYYADYTNRLKQAQSTLAQLTRQGDTANAAMERSRTIMESADRQLEAYQRARQEGIQLSQSEIANEQRLQQVRESAAAALAKYTDASTEGLQLLEGQVASERRMLQNAQDEAARAGTAFQNAQAQLKEMLAEQKRLAQEIATQETVWWKAGQALEDFGNKAEQIGKKVSQVGKGLTMGLTAPVVALGKKALDASISYESAFTNVRKTVDATEEEYAKLSDEILRLSTVIGAPAEEIAKVMATAGQLGIHNEDLVAFTKTMVDLSNAAEDLDADTAATQAAKFANVMQMDQSKFENLGAAVTDLGNNFATTEGAILEMAMRMAGAGKQVGMTEAQVLGFATALSSVGIEAQMGGSALSKALVKMEVAAETGGESLKDFAKVAGMSEKEFQKLWKSSPADAFQAFILGLAKLDEEGVSTIKTLSDIGINEIRLRDTILRTTNASELMTRAQQTANRAWKQNTALTTEVNKRYGTTEYKLKNLKNSATNLLRTVGNDLNPVVQSLMQTAQGYIDQLAGMDEGQRQAIERWAGMAAAAGPVTLVFGKIAQGVGGIAKTIAPALKGIAGFVGVMKTADGTAITKFGTALSTLPASVQVGGIVALTTAVVAGTAALVDYVSGAKAAREAIKQMDDVAQQWADTQADTFYKHGGLANLGLTLSDFETKYRNVGKWYTDLLADWNDGEKEAGENVRKWRESYEKMNAEVRAGLNKQRDEAMKYDARDVASKIDKDFARLKDLQKFVSSLLSNAKNRDLSKEEQKKLEGWLQEQHAIEVKYKLVPEGGEAVSGYEAIQKAVEAEEQRRKVLGYTDENGKGVAAAETYRSAIVAAMEARQALDQQIDAGYDQEYASLKKLLDLAQPGTKEYENLTKRIENLNEKYRADRAANYQKYAETIAANFGNIKKDSSFQKWLFGDDKGPGWLNELNTILSKPNKNEGLQDLAKFTENIAGEEGSLSETVMMLSQLRDIQKSLGDETFKQLFGDFNPQTYLDQLAGLTASLEGVEGAEGLYQMFKKSMPEEVIDLAASFGFEGIGKAFEEFKTSNQFTIDVEVATIKTGEKTETKIDEPGVDAYIKKFKRWNSEDNASPYGPDVIAWLEKDPVEGWVWRFNPRRKEKGGVDTSPLQDELNLAELTAAVAGYFASANIDKTDIDKPTVTAVATKIAKSWGYKLDEKLLAPLVTAVVTGLTKDPSKEVYDLKDDEKLWVYAFLKQIDPDYAATWAKAQNLSVEAAPTFGDVPDLTGVKAYVTEIDASQAGPVRIKGLLTSYDMDAITAYIAQGHSFAGQSTVKRSGTTLQELIANGAIVIDAQGNPVDVNADNVEAVVGGEDAIIGTNEKLQTVIVANTLPEITKEAAEGAAKAVSDNSDIKRWNWDNRHWGIDAPGWAEKLARWGQTVLPWNRTQSLDESTQRDAAKAVQTVADYVKNGGTITEETADAFKDAVEMITISSKVDNGAGSQPNKLARTETIANLRAAGYEVDNETLDPFLENLYKKVAGAAVEAVVEKLSDEQLAEKALKEAHYVDPMGYFDGMSSVQIADILLPNWREQFLEAGTDAAQDAVDGASETIREGDLSGEAGALEQTAEEGLNPIVSGFEGIGDNAVSALEGALQKGLDRIRQAGAALAAAAEGGAKKEAEIASPSRVWRDQIGKQMGAGLGIGLEESIEGQLPIVRNAMNYLNRDAARVAGGMGASLAEMSAAMMNAASGMFVRRSGDNTYNSSLNVQNMYMSNEMDAKALAEQMDAINRRVRRGYGAY